MKPTLHILHADNHLLVVNKPPGLVTQPSAHHRVSLEGAAKEWIKATGGKPGNVFLHPIHRLDRPVSGVVLFARTSKALSRLQAALRRGECRRLYWAVVRGRPSRAAARLRHLLVHDSFKARVVPGPSAGAKEALLEYRVVARTGELTLLEVTLVTGRYHQIRAQLAAAGWPILGDEKYGDDTALPGRTIALCHRELTVTHPTRGVRATFAAAPPAQPPWGDFECAAAPEVSWETG